AVAFLGGAEVRAWRGFAARARSMVRRHHGRMAPLPHAPGWQLRIDLGDGVFMPAIGCGTQYGFSDDGNPRGAHASAPRYIADALGAGFRLLDTARGYETEMHVMPGLAAARVDRREVFIVTKAWPGRDH